MNLKQFWKYQHSSHFNETNHYKDNRSGHTSGLQFPVPHILSWSLLDIDWLRSAFFSGENTLFSSSGFFSLPYQIQFQLKTNQMYIVHCIAEQVFSWEKKWFHIFLFYLSQFSHLSIRFTFNQINQFNQMQKSLRFIFKSIISQKTIYDDMDGNILDWKLGRIFLLSPSNIGHLGPRPLFLSCSAWAWSKRAENIWSIKKFCRT